MIRCKLQIVSGLLAGLEFQEPVPKALAVIGQSVRPWAYVSECVVVEIVKVA